MFKFKNIDADGISQLPLDLIIVINDEEFQCVRWIASKLSKVIKNYLRNNPKEEKFIIETEEYGDVNMIRDIFCGKTISFTVSSIPFLNAIATTLEIESLKNEMVSLQDKLDEIEQMIRSSTEINRLISLEKLLFSIKKFDFENVAIQIIECSIENDILSKFFLNACVGHPEQIESYVQLLIQVHRFQQEMNLDSVVPVFCNMLISRLKKTFYYDEDKKIQQEMCFVIEKLIENEFIESKDIIYQRTPLFFAHILNPSLFKTMCYLERETYSSEMLDQINENDFETHKKFVKIGKNMNNIAMSIRNDNLDELQQSLFEKDFKFNFNEIIPNSVYERCSFVNLKVTYIEYAAFFGSVKCFKYLLLNGAILTPNIAKFAVGGGNNEIIRICEQKKCDFKDTVQVAIKHHHWEILKWLISTEKIEFDKVNEYITSCIFFNNYKSLMTLLKNGIDPSLVLIESIRLNDLMLTAFLISLGSKIDLIVNDKKGKGLLQMACLSNNSDIVKVVLNNTNIDINSRTLHNDGLRVLFILLLI